MVVAMAFAAIALNDGVHALTTPAGESRPRTQLVPEANQKARADAIVEMRDFAEAAAMARLRLDLCDASGGDARFSSPPSSAR
jgi:hypothetical protein